MFIKQPVDYLKKKKTIFLNDYYQRIRQFKKPSFLRGLLCFFFGCFFYSQCELAFSRCRLGCRKQIFVAFLFLDRN